MGTLTDKELEQKYRGLVREPLAVHGILRVNHKPHPYMVGTRHVAYAANHCGGMLGREVCEKIPCAQPGCGASYDNHVSDHVLFVKAMRDCANKEVAAALFAIKEDMIADGLDGVAFVKSEFQIAPLEPEIRETIPEESGQ